VTGRVRDTRDSGLDNCFFFFIIKDKAGGGNGTVKHRNNIHRGELGTRGESAGNKKRRNIRKMKQEDRTLILAMFVLLLN